MPSDVSAPPPLCAIHGTLRGVSNSSDPQFQESWQNVYNKGPLKVLPWKVALGNHDWRGVVGAEVRRRAARACVHPSSIPQPLLRRCCAAARGVWLPLQIEFSEKDPRWNMPSRYFSFNNGFNGGCASFVFADTSPFVYSLPSNVMPTCVSDGVPSSLPRSWRAVGRRGG